MLVSQCNSIITIVQHDNAINDSNMSHFQQTFMLLLLCRLQLFRIELTRCCMNGNVRPKAPVTRTKLIWPVEAQGVKEKVFL